MSENVKKVFKSYYVATPVARKRFRKWLVENDLNYKKFSQKCGCSMAYISAVINGKRHITKSVIDKFHKAGYDLL